MKLTVKYDAYEMEKFYEISTNINTVAAILMGVKDVNMNLQLVSSLSLFINLLEEHFYKREV